jgi:hypothetical protein
MYFAKLQVKRARCRAHRRAYTLARKRRVGVQKDEIARRLGNIFLRDPSGRRPVFGGTRKFQEDPHWRDCLLFYEYFHGDNGSGLGASHQTGWTGIIARTMHLFATLTPEQAVAGGKKSYFERARAASESRTLSPA